MKDITGRELRRGDLVLNARTTYGWHSLAAIEGTETASGNPRIFDLWAGKKINTKSKHLIKITLEQFDEIFKEIVLEHRERNRHSYVEVLELGYKMIIDFHKRTNL